MAKKQLSQYSHTGCRRCKQMRYKCDESYPACTACVRKGVECFYDFIQFYDPEKALRKNKKSEHSSNGHSHHHHHHHSADGKTLKADSPKSESSRSSEDPSQGCNDQLPENAIIFTFPWFGSTEKDWSGNVLQYYPKTWTAYQLKTFIYTYFRQSKCVMNMPLMEDESNILVNSLLSLEPYYPIVKHIIFAVCSNHLNCQTPDSRWYDISVTHLNICIKLLARKVSSFTSFDEAVCHLAAVMLLFSERAATDSSDWRLHLKGAFGLMDNYGKLLTSNVSPAASNLYYLIKSWIPFAETVAWLSSPNGGSLTTKRSLEDRLNDTMYVSKSYYLCDGNFNFVRRCGQHLIPLFTEVTKLIMDKQGADIEAPPLDINDIKAKALRIYNDVQDIEGEHFRFRKLKPSDELKKCLKISHLSWCYALKLFILLQLLEENLFNEGIQHLTTKLIDCINGIPCSSSMAIVIHWPIFQAGLSCVHRSHRKVVLRLLTDCCNRGIHVARNSLERLTLRWTAIDEGIPNKFADIDCIAF